MTAWRESRGWNRDAPQVDVAYSGETDMTDVILGTLRLYLAGDIDLDSLEDRIIPLAWDDEFEDQDLVDQIAVKLVYIKDGVSDESIFRTRMAEILAQTQDITDVAVSVPS